MSAIIGVLSVFSALGRRDVVEIYVAAADVRGGNSYLYALADSKLLS